jgi:hypothetical protein
MYTSAPVIFYKNFSDNKIFILEYIDIYLALVSRHYLKHHIFETL